MKTIYYKIVFCMIFSCSFLYLKSQNPQCQTYTTENSGLPDDYVTSIAIDSEGNKWFGTWSGQVAKFDDITWTVYNNTNSGLTGHCVRSITIDTQGNKWFGTADIYGGGGGGIVKFDNVNWTVYDSSNSDLPDNWVNSIAIDAQGKKWIATQYSGVAKFDDTNWTIYDTLNSDLPDPCISAIAIDEMGNKWFGTCSGAAAKFDNTLWTIYNYSNSTLPYYNYINSIAIDDMGNKWFGVPQNWDTGGEEGLAKFDDVNWSFYNSTNSGLPYSVYSIAIDALGNKWFGTGDWWDAAIAKFDGTNWTVYNSGNSCLPNEWAYSIVIDALGNKWFGTTEGVIEFNENGISVGVNDKISAKTDDFIVYPNPAKDLISIKGIQSGIISIFSSTGELVRNFEHTGTTNQIDISKLPAGFYTMQVITDDGMKVEKFIKK